MSFEIVFGHLQMLFSGTHCLDRLINVRMSFRDSRRCRNRRYRRNRNRWRKVRVMRSTAIISSVRNPIFFMPILPVRIAARTLPLSWLSMVVSDPACRGQCIAMRVRSTRTV